jgi:Tfp pilus assembly protein PilF
LVRQALRHHRMGQFSEAEQIYLQALAIDPHHPEQV